MIHDEEKLLRVLNAPRIMCWKTLLHIEHLAKLLVSFHVFTDVANLSLFIEFTMLWVRVAFQEASFQLS